MPNQNTLTQYKQRLLKVMVYIESNLEDDLTIEQLARVSCFSRFHFQRIFLAFTGETVYGYVKRLRIHKAAKLLVYSAKSITEIAFDIGYATPSSFTKAFRQVIGMNPQALRDERKLPANQPITVKLIDHKEVTMQHTVITREEQSLLFLRKTGAYEESAPKAWRQMVNYAHENSINLKAHSLIAYAIDDPTITNEPQLRFDIGITGLNNPSPQDDMGVKTLAGGRYAVFEHHGHYNQIKRTFDSIYGHYLPTKNLEPRDAQAFVEYIEGDTPLYDLTSDEQKAKQLTLIYIPIH